MLKLVTHSSNGVTIWLGLTRRNLERLPQDQPIKVDLAQLGLGSGQIVLFAGEDPADLKRQLGKVGINLPDIPDPEPGQTIIHRPDKAN